MPGLTKWDDFLQLGGEATHNGEKHTAFIPSCFDGTAERGGEGVQRGMLELVEAFCLRKYWCCVDQNGGLAYCMA